MPALFHEEGLEGLHEFACVKIAPLTNTLGDIIIDNFLDWEVAVTNVVYVFWTSCGTRHYQCQWEFADLLLVSHYFLKFTTSLKLCLL